MNLVTAEKSGGLAMFGLPRTGTRAGTSDAVWSFVPNSVIWALFFAHAPIT